MRKIRIFTPVPLIVNKETVLGPGPSKHLIRVLRQKAGSVIELFNGDNYVYLSTLVATDPECARLLVLSSRFEDHESPLALHLLAGISKGERMDFTVQKAVELGIRSIQPVFCAATVVRLDAEKRQRRQHHWQEIAHAACEQCGRNRVPAILPPLDLEDALALRPAGVKLLLRGNATLGLRDLTPNLEATHLLIGPEGGLNEREVAAATRVGYQSIRLGPRILRTETAGIAAMAAMQSLWGDW